MREFEQRTYTRYACLGGAKLHLVGRSAETSAQVLNVSLGGCLLSFPTASTLNTGDDLEMSIVIGKTALTVRGWVVPGGNHQERVGVIFASMSAQSRVALSALIDELAAAPLRADMLQAR